MYALVDCRSFFASCEQVFRPELRDKPVVVLSNNDGCIVARSPEAKALDIPDLTAYFKVKDYLQAQNVHVFSSNYELYGDLSNRVMMTLDQFAPDIEVYSIDESFLLLDGLNIDLYEYGQEIKNTVWRDVRIPVRVGYGDTRTLAKLANHIAKKSKKLDGVCILTQSQQWNPVLKRLPVSTIWGVGSRVSKRLSYLDIKTVYDLKTANPKAIRKHFNVNLERTIAELNGERCIDLDIHPKNKKTIYSTRSFGSKVSTLEGLTQAISQYASVACQKLRDQNSYVKTISVFIETSRYAERPYKAHKGAKLKNPTNDTRDIIKAATGLLRALYKEGYQYAKAGVGLIELIDEKPEQLHFFSRSQSQKSLKLMDTINKLNKHEQQVFFASGGINPYWKMQRKLKSPAYTTRKSDFLKVIIR